jgi:DNA-binding NarL/FixJ family response regulator
MNTARKNKRTSIIVSIERVPTDHAKKIVSLLSTGYNITMIADMLNVNQRTLEAQISRIKAEYAAETLPHLVAIFMRNKVIV